MEELIRQYLESKGYHKAASSLVNEIRQASVASRPTVRGQGPSPEAVVEDKRVITALMADSTLTSEELVIARYQVEDADWAKLYGIGYDKYCSWAMSTLDVVKNDLLSICFPLFVQSYITLVTKECYDEARAFWGSWHQHHKDHFGLELSGLSMLTSRGQLEDASGFLESNPFVKCALKNKFRVRISNFAFSLLSTFLAQNDLLLSATIINDRIQFDRVEELQSENCGIEAKLIGYGAPNRSQLGQAYAGSGYGLHLAVPGKGKRPGQTLPDYRGNETYRTWLEFLVLRDAFNYSHTKFGSAGGNFFSSRSHQEQREWQHDGGWSCGTFNVLPEIRCDATCPSALFATMSNVNDSVICMDINRSVSQAVLGCRDNCVRVWDIRDTQASASVLPEGAKIRSNNPWSFELVKPAGVGAIYRSEAQHRGGSSYAPREDPEDFLEFRGHSAPVYGVSQDKSSRMILSGSGDSSIRLWDKNLRQCVGKFTSFSPVWDVSFGPLGYYFASGCMDRTVSVYSTDRTSPVRLMTGHSSDVTCVTWHDNATLVASGSDDKSVRVWDIRTGNTVRLLAASKGPISSIAISPVGDKLAAGSDNGMIHVWDIALGKHTFILQGHTGPVHSVGFNSEGTHIVSGSGDTSVRVWNLRSGAPMPETPTAKARLEVSLLKPQHSLFTKKTPVYHASYSSSDLIVAGGPYFSQSAGGDDMSTERKTEEEVIASLGLQTVKALGR